MPAPSRLLAHAWTRQLREAVSSLTWAPDGSALAVTTLGGEAMVLSADGEQHVYLPDHCGPSTAASWSADGTRLAVGGQDGRVDVCDLTSCRTRHHLFLEERIGALAWSPDGWLAAAAGSQVTAVTPDPSRRFTAPAEPGTVLGLLWAPSECSASTPAALAVAGVGGIRWYDVPFDDRPLEAWTTDGAILALSLAPRGRTSPPETSTEWHSSSRWWRTTQRSSATATTRFRRCHGTHGVLLAVVAGHELNVWRLDGSATTPPPRRLCGHHGLITDAAFSTTEALLASVGVDGHLVLWSPGDTPDPLERVKVGEEATCLDWGPGGGSLVTGSVDGAVQVFDLTVP